ncbi:MAG: response regulator transcription factor [Planctomycetes bacterium]|nr:response regulator transcription factor [Planctomycetota bacterium]
MTNISKQHIIFVDDEPNVRKMVRRTLEQADLEVNCFASAAECLKKLHSQTCDLLITDVKMPEMDGIELLTEVKRIIPSLPVLVITGYGDISMAVTALKAGASDFILKPLDRRSFLSAVETVLKRNTLTHPLVSKVLTKTEMRVLCLILAGKSTKEIARLRYRSVRTIEDQRSSIMHKLGVDNLVDLVKQTNVVRPFQFGENE